MIKISKEEAAKRQLNFAIDGFFRGIDPIVVHTVAGAAGVIFHDLVEARFPNKSWESIIATDNNMSKSDGLRAYREIQNFLKHADRDPDEVLEYDPKLTEHLIYFSSHNWCELNEPGEKVSIEVGTFQLWYHGVRKQLFQPEGHPLDEIVDEFFPNISELSRNEQIDLGLKRLEYDRKRWQHNQTN